MLTIKLNENTNSGMLYAIAYCEDPDIYSEDFWGWDTESDVGYELMEFGSLIQDADVFDSLEAAEDRADDVLSSIFENEVFIVGLDPYTPHNLTGFVKKITRRTMSENYCVYSSSNNGCYKEFTGTEDACNSWIKNNKWRFPAFVNLKVQPESEPAKWLRDFDTTESKSINESSDSEYWYFTKHGVQPGSIPKGANVLTIQDVENGTYVKLDRVLTTKELNDYEIIEKRPEGLDESKSINEDIDDPDEIVIFKREVQSADNLDDIQYLIYGLSDGVAEDIAQQAFNENESNDLETLKSAVITAIDVYLEDNEWLGDSKSIKESNKIAYGNEKYKGYMIRQDHKYGGYNVYDREDEMEDSGFKTIDKAKEFIDSLEESKSIKESSLVDKKVSTLGKRGKLMYFTAAQLKDAKAKYPEYDFEEATIDKSLPQGQKAYIAKKKTNESKSIKESATGDYVEVAYICDGFTNFRVFGGGFKTSDALVAVEDEKGKRLRLTMGDVCEFYTWYDAKGNVIHEPTYYSED